MSHQDPLDASAVPRLTLSPAVLSAIALGGALGTLARYLLDTAYTTPTGHFPFATLVINLSGSLAIGILVPVTDMLAPRFPLARPFLVVGILGGWTTYSTLAIDTVLLGKGGHVALGAAYVAASLLGSVLLVAIGAAAGRKVVPT
jgi:fluoride exporter